MKKRTLLRRVGLFSTFLLLVIANAGCTKDQAAAVRSAVTNYSKPAHWLALPSNPVKSVDVFYIYPTVWQKVDPAGPNYCPIDHPAMLKGAALAFSFQATAFETVGNVYAPYYRQADAMYMLNSVQNSDRWKTVGAGSINDVDRWRMTDTASIYDVTAAFDYYIKHYNHGKPFILAGHSQGSVLLQLLLSQYMAKHPDVYKRMIAAYVIGFPVTAKFMSDNKHLKFARGADDTGVIISYNTQSPSIPAGGNLLMGRNIGIVINPINWKRDTTLASASQSLGSFMPGANNVGTKVSAYADARVELAKGTLICSSVDEHSLASTRWGLGVYHNVDYQLYYYNIRENAERRVKKYLGK